MGKTHSNPFTKEQIDHLRVNHYVRSVSASTIRFSEDFKKYFYQKHHAGMTARQIFEECGIDPDILGESRIDVFCYTFNKQSKRETGFADNRSTNRRRETESSNVTVESRVKLLEHEFAYTRQEVEFLKKNANGKYGGSEAMGIQAPAEVKFAIIQEALQSSDNVLNIAYLCRLAGVSRFVIMPGSKLNRPVRAAKIRTERILN